MGVRGCIAAVVSLLCAAPHAAVAEETLVTQSKKADDHKQFGIMIDAGLPDGATASLVYEPIRRVRLHAGGGYNGIGMGVRTGVSLLAFTGFFRPTISLEVGEFFEANANPLARRFGASEDEDVLERVGYVFANARAGIELKFSRFAFYVHGGYSYINGTVYNLDDTIADAANDGDSMDEVNIKLNSDPKVTLYTVSARLGFITFF